MTATPSTLTTMPTKPDSGQFSIGPQRVAIYLIGVLGFIALLVIGVGILSPLPLVAGFILGTPRGGLTRITRIRIRLRNRRARKKFHGDYFSANTSTIEHNIVDEAIAGQTRQPVPEVHFQAQPYGTGWVGLISTPRTGHDTAIIEVRGGRFALAPPERQLAINQRLGRAIVEATEGQEEGVRLTFVSFTGPDYTMVDRLANIQQAKPHGLDLMDPGTPLARNLLAAFDACYKGATRTFTGYALSVPRPDRLRKSVRIPTDDFAGLPIFDMSRKLVAGVRSADYAGTGMVGAMDLAKYVRRGWDLDPEQLTRYMQQVAAERNLTDPTQAKTWLEAWPTKIDLGFDFIRIGRTFSRVLRIRSLTARSIQPSHFMPLYHMAGIHYSVAVPIDLVPADKAAKANNFEVTYRRGRLRGRAKGRREVPGDRDDLSEVEAREKRLHDERSPEAHYFPLLRITGPSLKELNRIHTAVENAVSNVNVLTETIEGEAMQYPAFLTALGLPLL